VCLQEPTETIGLYRMGTHTNGETLPNVTQRGGRALLGDPVKRFTGRRFVPPRHLCLAKTKWRRSQEQPHEALSAAVRANTRSRVRRLFSETGTLSPPSRRIVAIHTPRRPGSVGSFVCIFRWAACSFMPIEYSCAFAAATFLKIGAALSDRLSIRFHRRQWESLYPSSLSTSYPLGT
jgi:hypothetical protein